MARAGVLGESGREELLDGEIWTVPEGEAHARLKVWLLRQLVRWAPDDIAVACETTIRFADQHWPSPDFALFPSRLLVDQARGPDMLLVIEIGDSSLSDDLRIKGPKYREYGVREYWLIDTSARVTHVHRLEGGWLEAQPAPWTANLQPSLLPGFSVRLADSDPR